MANWALVIGINRYSRLKPLEYAVSDAEAMVNYFWEEAKFEQIFYFSDDSPDFTAPDGSTIETKPTYTNLWSFLNDFFEDDQYPPLNSGDNFWFFFSGHGMRHEDRDYLLPSNANPRGIEQTAISVNYVSERLRRSGADNVILFLDACRDEGDKSGLGIGMEKHQGVITFYSCAPEQKSYEIEKLGQGSFTYSLLEALRIQGENNCATVERLDQRLCYRVPLINLEYQKPLQNPSVKTDPASKLHLILLPQQATVADTALLKKDALLAEVEGNFELAEQLWIRVNIAAGGYDPDAIKAIQRLPRRRQLENSYRLLKLKQQATLQQDWGEAPDVRDFYGRTEELATLKQWVLKDRCRLVALLGMGGIGKTALSVKLGQQIQEEFEYVVWRSLRNAPPLQEILTDLIEFLSARQNTNLPDDAYRGISLLIDYLRKHRCLLILDNAESIMQGGDRAGDYQEGYEGYGQLLRQVGELQHQSCLVLTSRENPQECALLAGEQLPVRFLTLKGLAAEDVQNIFERKRKGSFSGSESEWTYLSNLYAGNPLMLKVVAGSIQSLYGGSISDFLRQGIAVSKDIKKLVKEQFDRSNIVEIETILWLGINREPVSLLDLQQDMLEGGSQQLTEALESLKRRSLIETVKGFFTLQPVIMECANNRLIEQISQEINTGEISLLNSHAIVKAKAKDYVRDSQIRLIVKPVADRVIAELRGKRNLEKQLSQILSTLREEAPLAPGYAAGNIINMLLYLKTDLRGYDFSQLTIRQAYLRGANLQEVNLAGSQLANSVFSEPFDSILTVALSHNGEIVATGDTNGKVRLWEVPSGKQIVTLKGHVSWVRCLAFSPDGKKLASCSNDTTVKIWNLSDYQCLHTLEGHDNWVWSIAFSPDGSKLASASDDATLRLWDLANLQCLHTLREHGIWVRFVAFTSDETLVSGSVDQTVKLWNVSDGRCLASWRDTIHPVRSIALSPDGTTLATGSDDNKVRLLDVRTGQHLKTFEGHTRRVWSVAFSPDGSLLASGSADRTLRLWDIQSGEFLKTKTLSEQTGRVRAIAFSKNGTTLATGSDDQWVSIWDIAERECLCVLQGYTYRVWSVAFSPQGKILASGSDDRAVRIWDISDGNCLKTLLGHSGRVRSVAFSPDGKLLASGSNDQTIIIWDVKTSQRQTTLQGHRDWIPFVAFSRDGTRLVSGSEDKTMKLWDVSEGKCLKTLQGHSSWVWSVAFSPDGKTLASANEDLKARLWDLDTGECVKALSGHTSRVRAVIFSPDGSILASASDDKTIKLWDVRSGECLKTLSGHSRQIRSVAFSPDGQILASGGDDKIVKLWNIPTGQLELNLEGHKKPVWSVAFSVNGDILASGGEDETINFWDVQTGERRKKLPAKRLYEGANITDVSDLNDAQKASLKALGAVED